MFEILPFRSEGLHKLEWKDVINAMKIVWLNVLGLLKLLLTLPAHFVECDRGILVMEKVKMNWYTTLEEQSLNDSMRVCLDRSKHFILFACQIVACISKISRTPRHHAIWPEGAAWGFQFRIRQTKY